ncbi:MAG TPA: hypothetical protein VHI30_14515 [Gaiellales bacterium]|nr:hypothetical protein [Gaiellales bacterium]
MVECARCGCGPGRPRSPPATTAAEEHLAAAERIFGDLRATRHLREIDAARAELTVVRMPRP